MYHNLGSPKPWNSNFTKRFFVGKRPSFGDLDFWGQVNSDILMPYPKAQVSWKLLWIKVFRFLFRFYGSK